jgi:hypothetical protein
MKFITNGSNKYAFRMKIPNHSPHAHQRMCLLINVKDSYSARIPKGILRLPGQLFVDDRVR